MKLKRFTTQLVAAGLIAVPLMANAAGLGKLSITSALGQPLAAEIELYAADKAELDSLSANLASDQAFRDARVEYAAVLSSLRFSVEKKPGGRAVLKVTSNRPVNDPFIDMLVELNWASGRLVREYTILLDPPGMGSPQVVTPTAVAPAVPAPDAEPAPIPDVEPAPAPEPAVTAAPAEVNPAPETAPQTETQQTETSQTETSQTDASQAEAPDSIVVKRGDTLSGIAGRVRPAGVSLEQTLLGLYRENAHAFDGNMSRLKAGKTLNIPTAEAVAAIPQKEAVREVRLQAADWRAYRQKLAAAVSAAPEAEAAPGQAASGKVTPKVEDRAKPAPESQQDVLKLSRAASAAAAAKADAARALQEKKRAQEEDATAREKALRESDQRVALLEKQVEDMQKLVEMKEQAEKGDAAASAPAPAEPAPETPAPAAEPAPKPPTPAPVVTAPPAAPAPTDNWYDPLVADPMYWGGGLAVLGLGGVLWWMMASGGRRRKTPGVALEDSLMTDGDVQPNTMVGAASGGSINTGDTSFLTDFSQAGLGTIDTHDVDPIAEAEVYMAYGRDAQAEEILKEAVGKNPDRPEIRLKLLEIYAARHNPTAFEAMAGELYAALGSKSSPLWDKACEMGREIDPTNPLYGGGSSGDAPVTAPVAATSAIAGTTAIAGGAVAFDTEPSAPKQTAPKPAAPKPAAPAPAAPKPEPVIEQGPMDFDITSPAPAFQAKPKKPAAPESGYVEMDTQGLNFDLPDLDVPASDSATKFDLGLDASGGEDKFDFGALDLDLGTPADGGDMELDEVGTKLDLARAYVEMGDKEGAREILNEVVAEGNDKQKNDAKGILSSLG